MDNTFRLNDLVEIDLQGYSDGETDPNCVTEVFDLHGKEVSMNAGNE